MYLTKQRAFARAALVGNPSDGYGGKTIAIIVRNYSAEAVLYEWDSVEIVLSDDDRARFDSVQDLARDVRLHGYYGGIRLIKATIRRFVDYCEKQQLTLHDRPFSIRYQTNIPRQVGLAGSSAIIVATLRCLMEFYEIQLPLEVQPAFVMSVEQDELGITVGLQDRVIQVYEGLVYMDFDRARERIVNGLRCLWYEPLNPDLLPPLYVAHHRFLSEPTEVLHDKLRRRFDRNDDAMIRTMRDCAELAARGREALITGEFELLAELMDRNFDNRRRIVDLPPWQVAMVDTARRRGASANFAGSGGAIVGIYRSDAMFETLRADLESIGSVTVKPTVIV